MLKDSLLLSAAETQSTPLHTKAPSGHGVHGASDGGPQFTLHSSFKDEDQPFEDFITELMTAIRRQHKSTAPADHTFKPTV